MRIGEHQRGTWLALGCTVAVLVVAVVLESVLSLGQRLGNLTPVLEVLFYVFIAALVAVGVVIPAMRVLAYPVRPLDRLYGEDGSVDERQLRAFERRLATLPGFQETYETATLELPQDPRERAESLTALYLGHVEPRIDAHTARAAKTAFFSTAVSQSSLVDGVTMLSINFDLVENIVETCGYRPTKLELVKLYARVMGVSLVAGSLEEADLESALTLVLGGGGAGKFSGVALASAAQGMANAFLVFRVASIVKGTLLSKEKKSSHELRGESYKEALGNIKESDFIGKVGATVKQKAESAAEAAVTSVRDKANEAGQAVYKGAISALTSMGEAVSRAGIGHSIKKLGKHEEPEAKRVE